MDTFYIHLKYPDMYNLMSVDWNSNDVKLSNQSTWITCVPKESMVSQSLGWIFI